MGIEEYLNTLCAELPVDPLRRDEIRLEVHAHLRERADALVQSGLEEEAAEARAVEEFGKPEELAVRLRQPRKKGLVWIASRHIEFVGVLLIAFGVDRLLQAAIRLSQYEFAGLSMNVVYFGGFDYLYPFLSLFFGGALLLRRTWAKTPTLLLTLLNPWLLAPFVLYVGSVNVDPERAAFSYRPALHSSDGIVLLLIGLYALWAFAPYRLRKPVAA